MMKINKAQLNNCITNFKVYLNKQTLNNSIPCLFNNSDSNVYSLCFYIFNLHLVQEFDLINKYKNKWTEYLLNEVKKLNDLKNPDDFLKKDKLQKFTFILSALRILKYKSFGNINFHNEYFTHIDVEQYFRKFDINAGSAQSGNYSMFLIIILLFLKKYHNKKIDKKISEWISLSINSMNSNRLWGDKVYLQFQNGYHQYEIFEYLNLRNSDENFSNLLIPLSNYYHFAPYPYGGSCYDYDAIFLLTRNGCIDFDNKRLSNFLIEFINNLFKEQNSDGGFCEAKYLKRDNYFKFTLSYLLFILKSKKISQCYEKIRTFISLLRIRNSKVITHWSNVHRNWDQSNLWDSYFRMLAIARIVNAFDIYEAKNFSFIDFPGIGYNKKKFQ